MGMTGIEQGRAAYAYSCASEGSKLTKKKRIQIVRAQDPYPDQNQWFGGNAGLYRFQEG